MILLQVEVDGIIGDLEVSLSEVDLCECAVDGKRIEDRLLLLGFAMEVIPATSSTASGGHQPYYSMRTYPKQTLEQSLRSCSPTAQFHQ